MNRAKHFFGKATMVAFAVTALMGINRPASANQVNYTNTALTNLPHQTASTWKISGINLNGGTITSAYLHFNGFYNWTTAAADPYNILWVDMADSGPASTSATDNTNGGTLGLGDVLDGFRFSGGTNINVSGSLFSGSSVFVGSSKNTADAGVMGYDATKVGDNPLGANGTGAFGTSLVTWNLSFGAQGGTVLNALGAYISNGQDIVLGFDSDCHFGDTSIVLEINYNPAQQQGQVPEPTSLLLVGTGVVALYRRYRQQRAL